MSEGPHVYTLEELKQTIDDWAAERNRYPLEAINQHLLPVISDIVTGYSGRLRYAGFWIDEANDDIREAHGFLNENNQKEGPWVYWYGESGTPILDTFNNYHDDQLDGDVYEFHSNGTISGLDQYINGQKDGLCIRYSDGGIITLTGQYHNDLNEGEWIQYSNTGKLASISRYKDGVNDGDSVAYYKNRTTIKSITHFSDGVVTTHSTYYPTGMKQHEVSYADGMIKEENHYYPSGQIRSRNVPPLVTKYNEDGTQIVEPPTTRLPLMRQI